MSGASDGNGGNGGNGGQVDGRRLVWDLALRLFHWSLVVLVAFAVWSGEVGGFRLMENHALAGYAVLALILFRLAWGVVGGRHARFADFVSSPARALGYAADAVRGRARRYAGHNPLGAWSVLALLACVGVQAVSGLFASDDILTNGPLHDRVSAGFAGWMNWLHYWNGNLMFVLIGIHVVAVLLYELKGERLIEAMIDGRKRLAGAEADADERGAGGRLWLAGVLLALAAGAVAALIGAV